MVPAVRAGEVDAARVAEHLAGAIRFPTISHADPADFDGKPFVALAAYLRKTYPLVHERLDVEVIADYSLLYTWRGSKPERDAALFMSHLDVVPVEAGTENLWKYPPFSGAIEDGYVWGRGALDIKCGVIVWLEAVEALLSEGFVPERTVYLAFGHDEELGGTKGAASIAKRLEDRGARIALLFDEGGSLSDDSPLLPGMPSAMVFVAEKTYLTLRLTA
jgi:carboxypeptidase PM20D1